MCWCVCIGVSACVCGFVRCVLVCVSFGVRVFVGVCVYIYYFMCVGISVCAPACAREYGGG